MIIYKDIVTGKEMATDSYHCVLDHGCLYKFSGKRVIERTDIDDSKIGGNASAEAAPEDGGAEASSVSGIDIVLANQLVEVTLSKKEFKTWLKNRCAYIKEHLIANKREGDFVNLAKKAAGFLLPIFEDCQFFVGEELTASNVLEKSPCAMVIALDAEDGKSVNMYIFKDGLEEEKA